MGKIIAVINQKGGVGKSTTALAIGAGLRRDGAAVLFVDLDAQGNLSYTLGADIRGYNAMGILERPETAPVEIQHTGQGDIIASCAKLAGADKLIDATGKEYRLKEALEPLRASYDYIVIDTPPALGILTINALTAADGAIIPAQADVYSLQGITQLSGTVDTVRRYCNKDLVIMGVVLTRYNSRSIICRESAELIEQTAEQLRTRLYKTRIRECTAIKEAQAVRQDIFTYAPRSNAAADYKELIEEIKEGGKT
jgi:chromosome partitioning protein